MPSVFTIKNNPDILDGLFAGKDTEEERQERMNRYLAYKAKKTRKKNISGLSMADQLKMSSKLLKPVVKTNEKKDSPRNTNGRTVLRLAGNIKRGI